MNLAPFLSALAKHGPFLHPFPLIVLLTILQRTFGLQSVTTRLWYRVYLICSRATTSKSRMWPWTKSLRWSTTVSIPCSLVHLGDIDVCAGEIRAAILDMGVLLVPAQMLSASGTQYSGAWVVSQLARNGMSHSSLSLRTHPHGICWLFTRGPSQCNSWHWRNLRPN